MTVNINIEKNQKKQAYLSAQLEELTRDLARLDLNNLNLTLQKQQALAAFNFIKIMHEKIEKAFTVDDLYESIIKALYTDLSMDSSALLKINYKTKKVSVSVSEGFSENIKVLKFNTGFKKQELLTPTFINSNSSLQPFHQWIKKSFSIPYFVWYPFTDGKDETLVLFVGNKIEDMMFRQPFSATSLETLGAIASVILLRRDNIIKTQEMLIKKEEQIDFLAEILKTSTISVIATDKDLKIIYVNPATENLFGYTKEELIGKNSNMFSAETLAPDIQKTIDNTVREGKVWRGEILNKKKNGDLFYIHASVYQLLDKQENFLAYVGFQEDITERKQAEEALQSSQERYKLATYAAKVGVWDWNIKTGEFYLDPIIKNILGYTDEEIPNDLEVWVTYVHQDDKEPVMEAAQACLEGKTPEYVFEHRMMHKDGSIRWVDVHGKVIRDEKGNAVRMVGTDTDITERKKVEEKLKRAQKELEIKTKNLEETNTALKVLLKHQDIEKDKMEKNILTSIKTLVLPYLEKIKIGASDERQKTFVNIIETNLTEITKPFADQLTEHYSKFTPTEIQIANLIRENKSTKDIAGILDISETTVFFHRRNIRTKLSIKNNKTNLKSYLQSIASK